MDKRPEVIYYYRGVQEGTPVYSRSNEYPWMSRRLCQQDAVSDNKKAVFEKEEVVKCQGQ